MLVYKTMQTSSFNHEVYRTCMGGVLSYDITTVRKPNIGIEVYDWYAVIAEYLCKTRTPENLKARMESCDFKVVLVDTNTEHVYAEAVFDTSTNSRLVSSLYMLCCGIWAEKRKSANFHPTPLESDSEIMSLFDD